MSYVILTYNTLGRSSKVFSVLMKVKKKGSAICGRLQGERTGAVQLLLIHV